MKLSSSSRNHWSLFLGGYFICSKCSFVDRDRNRLMAAHVCEKCQVGSTSTGLYFHVNIMVTLDLLEESYASSSKIENDENVESHNVAILLYFCTLKEALLEHFLNHIFVSLHLPEGLRVRLRNDNRMFNEKINKLLPALIDDKWSEAIVNAGKLNGKDYLRLNDLLVEAAELRNGFLHNASPWNISQQVAANCIDALPELLDLFVGLQNYYVHGAWLKQNSS